MTLRSVLVAAALAAAAGFGGYSLGHRTPAAGAAKAAAAPAARKPLYWAAPMNPSYHSDRPGKSPMGMDLVPVYADASGNGPEDGRASDVTISPQMVQQLGVQTAAVRQGRLARHVEAVGYVGYDEDLVTTVATRADGWIETLNVKAEGDRVRKGQLLYELFSPKLATAEQEYLTALASGMPSLVAASRERLRALGFTPGQVRDLARRRRTADRVARYADHAGVVKTLGVREGAWVMPATEVMKIADLSAVWVLVEVDESDASALRVGQAVTAGFDAFPGAQWKGVIDYVYPDVVAATRTVKVRLRFANADGRLRPNMYAHVSVDVAPQTTTYVPASALIRTGRSERVALALGGGRFDICPVVAGFQAGPDIQILKGLSPGQRVVVSSQFLIDSEANVDEATLHVGGGRPACRGAAPAARPMKMNMKMKMTMPANPATGGRP